jgi:hypothetical protein
MKSAGNVGCNFGSLAMVNVILLLVSAETGVIAALLWRFVLV